MDCIGFVIFSNGSNSIRNFNTNDMKQKEFLNKLYKEHQLTKEDVYTDKRGFTIITRSGVEKIQAQNNIKVEFEVQCCSLENVVIKAISYTFNTAEDEFEKQIETYGSASKNNCKQHFLVEIAEKRSLARCIIKTMRWTNTYGEDELENQPNETLNKIKND